MKYLMSIAWRTLPYISLAEILELLDNSKNKKYISGLELATTNISDLEIGLKYMLKNDLIFRCHMPKIKTEEELFNYLTSIGYLANKYSLCIDITTHSKESDNFEESITLTLQYLQKIYNYINANNLNITISLENLNYHHNHKRINVDNIDMFLKAFPNLKFTYDVGHDIYDNKRVTPLTNLQIERLENIHIHNVIDDLDHCLIHKDCEYILDLKQSMNNLKELNFSSSIVIEEAIDRYSGDSMKEKVSNYIQSFSNLDQLFFT